MTAGADAAVTTDAAISATLHELLAADGAPFSALAAIAGLKPAGDFRDADLRGVDFAGSDLTGYDFSGADLSGASFVGARIGRTRFWRAKLDGVAWPEGSAPDLREPEAAPLLLSPLQMGMVEALIHDLRRSDPGRALAVLPNGAGQTSIMAAVLGHLREASELRHVLVLTQTIAEREQVADRLRHAGFEATSGRRSFEEGAGATPGEISVETFGKLQRHLRDREGHHDPRGLAMGFSHVVLTSLPKRWSPEIAALAYQVEAPAMLGFTRTFADTIDAEGRLTSVKMREFFPLPAVICSLEQAVRDGLLQPAEVTVREGLLEGYSMPKSDRVDETASVMSKVAYDFAKELIDLPFDIPALIIIPDVEAVDRLVDVLDQTLHFVRSGEARRAAVAISSRHKRGAQHLGHGRSGMVAVMTPQMLDGFDVSEAGLIGVMGRLPARHVATLAFTSPHRPMRTIIDYTGVALAGVETELARPIPVSP